MSETMKEKTRRLERIVKGKNAGKTDAFVFSEVRKMIELDLAEEHNAFVKVCEMVRDSGGVSNGSQEYNDGRAMGAELCRNGIKKAAVEI